MTIQTVSQKIIHDLTGISDAPDIDAERIVEHVLEKDAAWLLSHSSEEISIDAQEDIENFVARRKTGEPLAYILGEWDFYGRTFMVTPDVLIPRPATEVLIEKAVSAIAHISHTLHRPLVIADIGTGSGCIAITLLLESPNIQQVIATDISEAALNVAQSNAEKFLVRDKISFIQGNMLNPIKDKAVDLIVSNPPYVPSQELLHPSSPTTAGLAFEPQVALDGGLDGLKYVHQLLVSPLPLIIETVKSDIITQNIDI